MIRGETSLLSEHKYAASNYQSSALSEMTSYSVAFSAATVPPDKTPQNGWVVCGNTVAGTNLP